MKRIVFCFDGTWNKLAVDTPTNVVLTAASVEREARDGTVQIMHYDEGVGTGRLDMVTGGVFGAGLVVNVRHAVAIDERRSTFPATLCGDLTALNAAKGKTPDAPDAPYQEKWFPGVHGSVGGGGDIRGLSDGALDWVLKGAKLAGLKLDVAEGSRIHGFAPDPLAPLVNVAKPKRSLLSKLSTDRPGPEHVWQVSTAAIRRWKADRSKLPEGAPYRPGTLAGLKDELDALTLPGPVADSTMATHVVRSGENLSRIALQYYRDAALWPHIFAANRDQIDDPDEIYANQKLRIPHPPAK
jgi:uncharacterized protein (DUF2235 family)